MQLAVNVVIIIIIKNSTKNFAKYSSMFVHIYVYLCMHIDELVYCNSVLLSI